MNDSMPTMPNQCRSNDEEPTMLLPTVHRSDAYREITEARRKLDDERERQISARDTDRAPTAEGCQTCLIPLPGCVDFDCPQCIGRHIQQNMLRAVWGSYARMANAGRQHSILDEIMAEINRLDKVAQIALIKQSHKGEWA